MPSMIRPKGKAKKIAYAILGVPANIAYKRSEKQKRLNRRMNLEDTMRVK